MSRCTLSIGLLVLWLGSSAGAFAAAGNPAPSRTILSLPLELETRVTSQSVQGFCASVSIRNVSSKPHTGWMVEFSLGANTLRHLHQALYSIEQDRIVVTPFANREEIGPGQHRQFELCTEGRDSPSVYLQSIRLISLSLLPQISIASPTTNETLSSNAVLVYGTYSGPRNTGIVVNGVIALTDGQSFYANNVPLQQGSNSIVAIATTPEGRTAQASVTVNSSAENSAWLNASPDVAAPLTPVKYIFSPGDVTDIQLVSIDFDGNGTIDFSTSNTNDVIEHVFMDPGIYVSRLTLRDKSNREYVARHAVQALDLTALNTILQGIYNGMLSRFRARDIDGALMYVTVGAYGKYSNVFRRLTSKLPEVADKLGTLREGTIGERMAEYVVVRDTPEGPQGFLIYFIRGEDGVWRIDSM